MGDGTEAPGGDNPRPDEGSALRWLTRRRLRERPSERARSPQPLIRKRVASGRGATEQPNVTSDGDAAVTAKFWVLIVVTGVVTGLFGDFLMLILFSTQHIAFNYHSGMLQSAVERDSDTRRVVALLVSGAFGGVAWYVMRRLTPNEKTEVDDAIWRDEPLSARRSFATSIISELVIGMGASIGREAAPRLMGGVTASTLSSWARLTPAQRRLLVACGAGAGLAAVYNVPFGGAIFTAEVLYGSLALPVILPALACSLVATATAWLYLPQHATYLGIPSYPLSMTLLVFSVLVGPVVGVLSVGYTRLFGWVAYRRVKGAPTLVMPLIAFAILGLLGIEYPQLFGNGKDIAHMVFVGSGGLALLFALFALKPIVTAMCLGSGATGGLFTPTLATGALLGGFLGLAWSHAWPGAGVGAFAMVGAAAMIGASMQAPLAALALVVELTHSGLPIMVPMAVATVSATAISRHIDGYSIYTARLASL